jgi:sulfite reductase beta subunit-like hemoprotein
LEIELARSDPIALHHFDAFQMPGVNFYLAPTLESGGCLSGCSHHIRTANGAIGKSKK